MSLTPKLLQQGAAGSARPVYIEDVFSTYLYTGNAGTQTITNDIDLSGKGGLVWAKLRNAVNNHALIDTVRPIDRVLDTSSTSGQSFNASALTSFNNNGFTLGGTNATNGSGYTYASWTFREQAKFFDIVTLTADGSGNATFSHNLGTTPGCVILKRTDGISSWYVWHRSLTSTNYSINLHQTGTQMDNGFAWITPSASTISINGGYLGASTQWVAYLFAHNAGGFGLTGSDNVISCGSYAGGAGTTFVTLGYEPQFILKKNITSSGNWVICDNMRGMPTGGNSTSDLFPNTAGAETVASDADGYLFPTATGFGDANANSGQTYIYIAIRKGPMKVPTDATKVYKPINRIGTGDATTVSGVGFPPDLLIAGCRTNTESAILNDRLRGKGLPFYTDSDVVERAGQNLTLTQDGWNTTSYTGYDANQGTVNYVNWFFRRAPSFFDIVCYTGTGSGTQTISHNLGVTPELTINKSRSGTRGWTVYYNNTTFLRLNQTNAGAAESLLSPTSTTFNAALGAGFGMNAAETYVTFLFASCPGVSKVGSYTGNGSTQTIDCGFAAGARFILIKRTNASGDWYVFDSIRGIVSGNDPFLKLNTNGFDTSSYDAVDPANSGFIVNNDDTNFPINVASATYIFLAIA